MMTKKDKTWIQQSIFLSIFELESQIHSSHSFANEKLVIYHFVKNLMLFLHLLESELELNHGSFFGGSFIFFFFSPLLNTDRLRPRSTAANRGDLAEMRTMWRKSLLESPNERFTHISSTFSGHDRTTKASRTHAELKSTPSVRNVY